MVCVPRLVFRGKRFHREGFLDLRRAPGRGGCRMGLRRAGRVADTRRLKSKRKSEGTGSVGFSYGLPKAEVRMVFLWLFCYGCFLMVVFQRLVCWLGP